MNNLITDVIDTVLKTPDDWISKLEINDDWECACRKYEGHKYRGVTCGRCGTTVGTLKKNRLWLTLLLFKLIYADYYASLALDKDKANNLREMLLNKLSNLVSCRLGSPISWSAYQYSEENALSESVTDIVTHIRAIYQSRSTSLVPLINSCDFILIGAKLSEQSGYGHGQLVSMIPFVQASQIEIFKSLVEYIDKVKAAQLNEQGSAVRLDVMSEKPREAFFPMRTAFFSGTRVQASCLILMLYGIYRTIRSGFDPSYLWYTYEPVGLGLLSFIIIAILPIIQLGTTRFFYRVLGDLLIPIPVVASFYMFWFLGMYGICSLVIHEFHWTVLLRSLLFVVLGSKCTKHMLTIMSMRSYIEKERKEDDGPTQ